MTDLRGQETPAPAPTRDPTAFYETDLSALPGMRGPADMPQPTLGELWHASVTEQRGRNSDADRRRLYQGYQPILEVLNADRSPWRIWKNDPLRRFGNPGEWADAASGGAGQREEDEARIWAEIARRRAADPGFLPDVPADADAFHAELVKREQKARAGAAQVIGQNHSLLGSLAVFAGGAAKSLDDPLTIATLPVGGGGRSIAMKVLTEGVAQAGVQAFIEPLTVRNLNQLGERVTALDVAGDIGMAGATGAGVQGLVVEPLVALAKRAIGRRAMTEAERGAVDLLERDAEISATSPFTPGEGTEAHLAKLDAAIAALNTRPEASARARLNAGTAAVPRETADILPDVSRGTPAAAMPRAQFKSRVRGAESSGNDLAAARTSSAFGRYQFTADTWLRYYKRRYGQGALSNEAILARRADGAVQEQLMDDLTADNAAALARIGAPETPGNLYLMHFAGQGGATKILRAAPDTPIERLLSADAISANGFLRGKTAEDVIEWAHGKMGDTPRSAPLLRREQFADDAAGDAEWSAAQRALDDADAELGALARAQEAEARAPDDPVAPPPLDAEPLTVPRETGVERDAAAGMDWEPVDLPVERPLVREDKLVEPTIPPLDEASELGPRSVLRLAPEKGEPGIAIVTEDGHVATAIYRDAEGVAHGAVQIPVTPAAREIYENASAYVDPSYRRQGIATKLYDALDRAGFPINERAGAGDVTPDGAAFVNAWRGRRQADAPDVGPGDAAGVPRDVSRGTGGSVVAADAVDDAPATRFDDPYAGEGAATVTESLEHDIRMLAEAEPDRLVQLGEGDPQRLSDVLRDLDDDEAAIAAARACMVPPGADL